MRVTDLAPGRRCALEAELIKIEGYGLDLEEARKGHAASVLPFGIGVELR